MRLGRSKRRAHHLRIQAWTLLETGEPALTHAALDLITELVDKYPEPFELASAQLLRAQCLVRLERLPEAIEAFRASFAAQRTMPNVHIDAYLDFAWLVGTHDLRAHYDEALSVMQEFFESSVALPAILYRYFGALAFITQGLGDRESAARWAKNALEAAATQTSPFSRHPGLGLVQSPDASLLARLQSIATSVRAARK